MTTQMVVATVAWLLLSAAYVLRSRKLIHIALANAGIALDITLVLYLQFTREALQTAASFELGLLPQFHIFASSAALVLYFPTLLLGWKLLLGLGGEQTRERHIRFAMLAYLLRTLGFAFMFTLIGDR